MPLCGQCFRNIGAAEVCPFCGFDGREQQVRYPVALMPGTILGGRYIVGRVLGQGGFGITYLALDDRTKDKVAIKEYYPAEFAARAAGSTFLQVFSGNRAENFAYGKAQFLEEARTLAAVTGSTGIIRIYSYFEENGTAYFAMEYVDGRPLDIYMKELGRPLTAEQAENLFLPLMASLEGVHRKGIVHRDIAPDNILVARDGTAKLIDFGAARYSTGEKSKSLDVILKHGFAPMEQYTRRGRQGPWTDVYALAATFYFAVTGRVPPDAIERIEADTLARPGSLGVQLGAATEAVLMKALSVQSSQRWQNMGEFRGALQAAAMSRSVERQKAESDRLVRERAEKEARERQARERAEQEARERQARERAEQETRERQVREREGQARQQRPEPDVHAKWDTTLQSWAAQKEAEREILAARERGKRKASEALARAAQAARTEQGRTKTPSGSSGEGYLIGILAVITLAIVLIMSFSGIGSNSSSSSPSSSPSSASAVSSYISTAQNYVKTGNYHSALKAIMECYDKYPESKNNTDCKHIVTEIERAVASNEPTNGQTIRRTFPYMGSCVLRVTAQSGPALVTIFDSKKPDEYCTFYVRKGQTAETTVTGGIYLVNYEIGYLWFGDDLAFGDFSDSYSYSEEFIFKVTQDNAWVSSNAWEITV